MLWLHGRESTSNLGGCKFLPEISNRAGEQTKVARISYCSFGKFARLKRTSARLGGLQLLAPPAPPLVDGWDLPFRMLRSLYCGGWDSSSCLIFLFFLIISDSDRKQAMRFLIVELHVFCKKTAILPKPQFS